MRAHQNMFVGLVWFGLMVFLSGLWAAEPVFGPHRNDPAAGIPKHAYSPFEAIAQRDTPGAKPETIPGQVLIKLAPSVRSQAATTGPASSAKAAPGLTTNAGLNRQLKQLGIQSLSPVFRKARRPAPNARLVNPQGETVPLPDLTQWQRATLKDPARQDAVIEQLRKQPGIERVEPDYLRRPTGMPAANPQATPAPAGAAGLPSVQTDPHVSDQWHLAAIKAPEAWQWLQANGYNPGGSRDVIVAVIDTGVDLTHPDLSANLWTNGLETPDNGIDDDQNGFIDDVHGVSVVGSTYDHKGDPQDDHGHGTHVAGIIAARADNGLGGVGIAHNVQIMAIKAAQYSGVLAASDIAEGILYATTQGADVINMSFGGYGRSQVEEDALAVAFGQSVLVAAAGNQGRSNDRVCDPLNWGAMYPAAYNWVLGVMAQAPVANGQGDWLAGFSNYDCLPGDTVEYELMAPGVDILSTLPGDRYAAWDGTSMAAPIASGIAALVRTRFPDKQVYSSRFVMGQVASTGGFVQARHQGDTPVSYRSADALAALTATPKPSLGYLEHWLFDTKTQAAGNNGNGRIDAGETVDLAIVIKNRWGNASDVNVKLEAQAEAAQGADPCVSFSQNTVNYGAVGAFATDDNGLIRDAQGAIIGVANPFRFTVSATCPNDHVIPFKLTMTARNGLDPNDAASYTTTGRFYLIVQRGRELPRLIDQDMTLTKEDYWLVPDGTLVNPGVTLTVTEGTQVQFFTSDSASPYARVGKAQIQVEGNLRVRGTADEPVQIFPSPLFPTRPIQVRAVNEGDVIFEYAEITNPIFRSQDIYSYNNSYVPLKLFDHTRLYQWSIRLVSNASGAPNIPIE